MKYFDFIFLLFGLIFYNAKSQNNLIHNASFETSESGKSLSPCRIGQGDNLDVWEDDHNFVWSNPLDICSWLDCDKTCGVVPCKLFHSPDWYFDNGTKEKFFERICTSTQVNSGCVNSLSGHSGNGYIGMRASELIEQKFFNSNPIISGKKYTFSLYIRIPNDLTFSFNSSSNPLNSYNNLGLIYNIQSQFRLSIYLATQKIKYQDGVLTCNYGDEGDDKKDLSNNIVKINEFSISPMNYPYGQWHKLSFEFICPSNHNYDWIAIEQNKDMNDAANRGYILIDDVSLIESCELGCYPTSGIPNPVIGTPTTGYNVPLQISNLNNVEKAKVEIFPLNGASPIVSFNYHYSNGIPFNIYWNGYTSSAMAASGIYICKLVCENDCGTFTFAHQFFHGGSLPPLPISPPNSKIEEKLINPCCLLDYTISNKTMNGMQYFKPRNNLYVNSNVFFSTNSNITLVAGQQIEFLSEIEANANSEIAAYIEDCPDSHREGSGTVLTEKDFEIIGTTNFLSTSYKSNDYLSTSNYSIIPNPNNGSFNYIINKPMRGYLYITNQLGIRISEMEVSEYNTKLFVNLSGMRGVYYLNYLDVNGILLDYQKIIIQ